MGLLEVQGGLNNEVIVGVLLVREKGTVVVQGLANILDLS